MALTISRKPGQSVRVGDDVLVTVVRCSRGRTRICIDAPEQVTIVRTEADSGPGDPGSGSGDGSSNRPGDGSGNASGERPGTRQDSGPRGEPRNEPGSEPLDRPSDRQRRSGKSRTASGVLRCLKAVMPRALPPLAERRDALAMRVLKRRSARRGGDSGPAGTPVLC